MTAITPLTISSLTTCSSSYCLVDDLYAERVPRALFRCPQYECMEMSDAEMLTLSVVREALSIDSASSFIRFIQREYEHLFARLLSRDCYSQGYRIWISECSYGPTRPAEAELNRQFTELMGLYGL